MMGALSHRAKMGLLLALVALLVAACARSETPGAPAPVSGMQPTFIFFFTDP